MRITSCLIWVLAAGCGSSSAVTNLLCTACTSDAECGGNPCFADVSSQRYCGRPCDACPAGFSCEPVTGTAGQVMKTCFPTNEACATTMPQPGVDLSGGPPQDLSQAGAMPDLSTGRHDLAMVPCTPPVGGTVTTSGGTVDRLYFGYTGDTRPVNSSSSYPQSLQTVADGIYSAMAANGVEFALDGGDHMEASSSTEAAGNMTSYAAAVAKLNGKPVFMTMGNHECSLSYNPGPSCGGANAATTDIKMKPYMASLKTISGQTSPYYRFDIMTNAGKATFIVIADDAWNDTQQTWLTTQLTDADANSKYTFVSKHHPDQNMDQTYFQTIYNLVTSHKYTLFLTGHSHEYKHQYNDKRGVVMGLGGAPFDNPNQMWWGYLTATQCPDDSVTVTVYDESTGAIQDSFNVPPQ